jgi:outer membrane protein TolC
MKRPLTGATVLLIGTLTACSFAPVYKAPDSVPAASAYKESGDWKASQPLDDKNRGEWWTLFRDPQLDALEAKVGDANENLKAAFARLQQARAATRIARADLFPTLTAGASATRSRTSVNSRSAITSTWKPTFPTSSTSGDGCATRSPLPRRPSRRAPRTWRR